MQNRVLRSMFQKLKRCTRMQCTYATMKRRKPLDPDYINEMPVNQYIVKPHERNRIYAWGNIQTGALGVPLKKAKENLHQVHFFKSPKRVGFGEFNNIHQVATGFGFTLLASERNVYGTGLNEDSQLGYHEMRHDQPLGTIFSPLNINLDCHEGSRNDTEKPAKIRKISAGRAHSAVLTDSGLFLFGNNAYGQCGREIINDEKYTGNRLVNYRDKIDGKAVVDVECGQDHTLVLLEDGQVFACGWGADGQTGLGHYNSSGSFAKVVGDVSQERIVRLACRSDFVLAISELNDVFGWGNTEYSQMPSEDGSQQVCTPMHLSALSKLGRIKDVAAGGSFCMLLTEAGEIYVWGFGLLGLGPMVQESKVPLLIPAKLFGKNDFNVDASPISIHAGLSHMAAVTNKGDLFTWGRNRSCCLGQGHEKDQYFPLKVALGASVQQVSCGLDHMIAVCKSYVSK